ncbi:T9SS type A sorting domain-containing protein [bacterium]|nr:T9SS type A sorting domain-containing protein [bacterium]
MKKLCVLILLLSSVAAAQTPPRLSYFPLETGNSWTYHVTLRPGMYNEVQFDTTITVGDRVTGPNGKQYYETSLGLLRVDSTTGMVWRYYPNVYLPPLSDTTRHCVDSTEMEFTYLAADSGATHIMCGDGWPWHMYLSDSAETVEFLDIQRRRMYWSGWLEAHIFADSIGLCYRVYTAPNFDVIRWELVRAFVHGVLYTPVQLRSFTVDVAEGSALLQWDTEEEMDNLGFEVQRRNGVTREDWNVLGFVPSHGRSASSYSFHDRELPAVPSISYRIKQIDYSGKTWYSPEFRVDLGTKQPGTLRMEAYPNPLIQTGRLRLTGDAPHTWQLTLQDMLGRSLRQLASPVDPSGVSDIALDLTGLPAGQYFVVATRGAQRISLPLLHLP